MFGLHFIIFAWKPYIVAFDSMTAFFEITTNYPEIFLNSLHGLVASIACCFIQQEVRAEIKFLCCLAIYKIRCLRCLKCFAHIDRDYIHSVRFSAARHSVITQETATETTNGQSIKRCRSKRPSQASVTSNGGIFSRFAIDYLCFLYDTKEKNDFFKANNRSNRKKSREFFQKLVTANGRSLFGFRALNLTILTI